VTSCSKYARALTFENFCQGRTTLRAAPGVPQGAVVVRGPKGKDVLSVDLHTSRVLLQNLTLIRSRSRKEPLPAAHLHVVEILKSPLSYAFI